MATGIDKNERTNSMSKKIEIRKSKIKNAGRGVFALTDIKKGEVIEICPILIFPGGEYPHLSETKLSGYLFEYTGDSTILALGFGSMYNHTNTPNAKYEMVEYEGKSEQNNELYFVATKPIKKDEEIYINYGGQYKKLYSSAN